MINAINKSVQTNNSWSAQQAQKQMDFQKMMSNTAHQREVADLKAAGLNPILSAGGQGASSAAGAMANPDQSGTGAIASMMGSLINSQTALANALTSAETSRAVADIAAWSAGNVASINTSSAQSMQKSEQEFKESHPETVAGILSGLLNSTAKGLGYSSTSDMVTSAAKNYYSKGNGAAAASGSGSGSGKKSTSETIKQGWNVIKNMIKGK